MIRAILSQWRLILTAIVIVAAAYVLHLYGNQRYEHGRAEVQAVFDAYRAEQVLAVERQQQEFQQQQEQAHAQHIQDLARARADARSAAAAADSLRQQLSTARHRLATTPRAAAVEYATAAADVFEQCTDRYRALAADADGHVATIKLMQAAWPRSETTKPAEAGSVLPVRQQGVRPQIQSSELLVQQRT